LQTTSPESKFPSEYSDVIFIQIDQHLKKLLQKYKGVPILWNTVYMWHVEWYHVCWPRLTAKRVEPVVSISWASCYLQRPTHVAEVRYYVTTTVSSVNFSVQDSMSIQYSCGEISFTQHSMVQFQTSTHLQRLVHPAVPPAAQQPTHWKDSHHVCLWGWCSDCILCKWCQYILLK